MSLGSTSMSGHPSPEGQPPLPGGLPTEHSLGNSNAQPLGSAGLDLSKRPGAEGEKPEKQSASPPPTQRPPQKQPPVTAPPIVGPAVQRVSSVGDVLNTDLGAELTDDFETDAMPDHQVPGWGTSLIVHMLLIIGLGLMIPWIPPKPDPPEIIASFIKPGDEGEVQQRPDAAVILENASLVALPMSEQIAALEIQLPGTQAPVEVSPVKSAVGFESSLPQDLMRAVGGRSGDAWEGRQLDRRRQAAFNGGGTPDSEAAVERGLRWLAAHQLRDGSWRFNHHLGLCQGQCRNPGSVASSTAATALGLLPFLGAGHTHMAGDYQPTVKRGLDYLMSRALTTPHGADLQEGTMYAQGLATMALCEAYGMTQDPYLKEPAQAAIDFIVNAQHSAGGWRYAPGQPGDTTVTGWQVMALKSGQMAYLRVPRPTLEGAQRFLNSVQADGGSRYGYQEPGSEPTTSSVGLLLRMYDGWTNEQPSIIRGVDFVSEDGPSSDNMYFNYYATQVLHHAGGPQWQPWNEAMRDMLVNSQATRGHENGSWYFAGGRCVSGGRLLGTSLALLTLEVYYRYLPLYRTMATDADF